MVDTGGSSRSARDAAFRDGSCYARLICYEWTLLIIGFVNIIARVRPIWWTPFFWAFVNSIHLILGETSRPRGHAALCRLVCIDRCMLLRWLYIYSWRIVTINIGSLHSRVMEMTVIWTFLMASFLTKIRRFQASRTIFCCSLVFHSQIIVPSKWIIIARSRIHPFGLRVVA
jgi:hypothetical protein